MWWSRRGGLTLMNYLGCRVDEILAWVANETKTRGNQLVPVLLEPCVGFIVSGTENPD